MIKKYIPKRLYTPLRDVWHSWKKLRFYRQSNKTVDIHGVSLVAPSSHPIEELIASQPYRDLCVALVAKYASSKYPERAIFDIGANIGDTASLISLTTASKLILIEGSDYFFTYLQQNAKNLPNKHELHQVMLGDGSNLKGSLLHWGGTAYFDSTKKSGQTQTCRLSEVTDDLPSFVKLDTDGHDASILLYSIDWVKRTKPSLLLEFQIRNEDDLNHFQKLTDELHSAEYSRFIFWNSAGEFFLSSTDPKQVMQIAQYLLRARQTPFSTGDLDLACFHDRDEDIYQKVIDWYADNHGRDHLDEWISQELKPKHK